MPINNVAQLVIECPAERLLGLYSSFGHCACREMFILMLDMYN